MPPPHTLYNRGRCTLEIGPHLFPDTTVFEVHYHPVHVQVPSSTTFVYQSAPSQWSAQSKSSTSSVQVNDVSTTASPASVSGHATPLPASLPPTLLVTQTLVTQVNQAASSNPTLANLLQVAVAGKASPDQLKTLGLLIQSLAGSQSTEADATQPSTDPAQPKVQSNTSTSTTPTPAPQYQLQPPSREFDLILDFKETPTDRWTFPRGPTRCEFIPMPGSSCAFGDILVTTAVPFTSTSAPQSTAGSAATSEIPSAAKQTVTFRFKSANTAVWDTMSRWIGSRAEEYSKTLSEIVYYFLCFFFTGCTYVWIFIITEST